MKQLPIRVRLTVWYLVVFSLALGAFGASVWVLVRQRLLDEVNHELQGRAEAVEHFLLAQRAGITPDEMRRELFEEYQTEDEVSWLQIVDAQGAWMFRSQPMAQYFDSVTRPDELQGRARRWDTRAGHVRLRVIEQPVTAHGQTYTIQTAVVTNGVHHTLENLETVFFWLAPGFVLIAAVGSYFMSKRALSTVDAITAMARSIHDRNLDSRLPALQSNDELQRLSDTLNEMLGRIERSFQKTRQFTADASHELRTPLSLIRTEAELTLRKTRTEAEYRQALEHILHESERTTELIESLLTLARTDSGAEVLKLRPLECVAFLRRVAEDWQPLFAETQLTFNVVLPAREAVVNADEPSLRRLMMLLLDNARKYTPARGSVTLRAEMASGGITVAVEDTGIGIDAEHQPRIFDRFYRVDKVRTRSQGGAGLGLSLAKWIAAQHHTEIVVESKPGMGSKFSFRLQALPQEVANGTAANTNQKTERVV